MNKIGKAAAALVVAGVIGLAGAPAAGATPSCDANCQLQRQHTSQINDAFRRFVNFGKEPSWQTSQTRLNQTIRDVVNFVVGRPRDPNPPGP